MLAAHDLSKESYWIVNDRPSQMLRFSVQFGSAQIIFNDVSTCSWAACIIYKVLYNWSNETIDKEHKQCP